MSEFYACIICKLHHHYKELIGSHDGPLCKFCHECKRRGWKREAP